MFEYRKGFTAALNLKMLQNGAYLGLPNEEWAVKVMVNLLINQGICEDLDAKKREEIIQGQSAYMLHATAAKVGNESQEAAQVKAEAERHI